MKIKFIWISCLGAGGEEVMEKHQVEPSVHPKADLHTERWKSESWECFVPLLRLLQLYYSQHWNTQGCCDIKKTNKSKLSKEIIFPPGEGRNTWLGVWGWKGPLNNIMTDTYFKFKAFRNLSKSYFHRKWNWEYWCAFCRPQGFWFSVCALA